MKNIRIVLQQIYNKLYYRPILKSQFAKVGSNFRFGYCGELLNPQYFSFGNNFFSGPYGYFVTNKYTQVRIGNDVMFGPFCKIIGGNHDVKWNKDHLIHKNEPETEVSIIEIEDGAWIGANCMILSGAKIGEGSIIGANSLINKNIPPYTIAVGSPVNKYKPRFNDIETLEQMLNNVQSKYKLDDILSFYDKISISLK